MIDQDYIHEIKWVSPIPDSDWAHIPTHALKHHSMLCDAINWRIAYRGTIAHIRLLSLLTTSTVAPIGLGSVEYTLTVVTP